MSSAPVQESTKNATPQGEQQRALDSARPLPGQHDEEASEASMEVDQIAALSPTAAPEAGEEVSALTAWSVAAGALGMVILIGSAATMLVGMGGVRPGVTLGMLASLGGMSLLLAGLLGAGAAAALKWVREGP